MSKEKSMIPRIVAPIIDQPGYGSRAKKVSDRKGRRYAKKLTKLMDGEYEANLNEGKRYYIAEKDRRRKKWKS